jgi:putative intracellular protease/amidase
MKHLTIIVPNGENNLSSIVGAYKLFTRANEYWTRPDSHRTGKKKLFAIQLAGLSKKVEFYEGLFTVKPHISISAIKKTDLIIIPSLNHNYNNALKANKPLVEWIAKQYNTGAEVASICTGAFLLASSGLWMEKIVPHIGLLRRISGTCFQM